MKSVKVHDDTHRSLKRLKAKRRGRSIDQVIRELMRAAGSPVDDEGEDTDKITKYVGQ